MRSFAATVLLPALLLVSCARGYEQQFPWGIFVLGEVTSSSGTAATPGTVDDYSTLVNSEPSLLAYWRLNEAAVNGTTVVDSKGGFDGTFTGTTGTPAQTTGATDANDADGAYSLTAGAGDDYRVVVPATTALEFTAGQSVTLELWLYPNVLNEKMEPLSMARIDGTDDPNYVVRVNGGKVGFFFGDAASPGNVVVLRTDDFLLRKNEWWHVVVTHTYGSIADSAIYVNGIERSSSWIVGAGTETPITPNKDLWIGASNGPLAGAVDNVFEGRVDEVAIYNSILSADAIRSHFRTANNKFVQFMPTKKIVGVNDVMLIEITGGTAPYTYSVVSGSGSINASGVFTAPATMGSTTLRVTDASGSTDDVTIRHYVEPDDVGGLLFWFSADSLSYAANAAIPLLNDRSGNGNDGGQGTAVNQPTFLEGQANGYPVISFDGGDFLQLPINSDAGTIPFTLTGIIQSNGSIFGIVGQGAGTNPILVHHSTCGGSTLQTGFACPGGLYTAGTPIIHSSVSSIAAIDYYADGAANGLGSGTAWGTSGANWFLGSLGAATLPFTGVIGELLLYNSALSVTDRGNLECYLSAKYDRTVDAGLGCP